MKTNEVKKIDKTVIQELREIREIVSLDIKDMSIEQLKEYFSKKETLHPKWNWLQVE